MTGAISTIFPNWNHAQGEAALQKRKSDSFTVLLSRILSSKFHIIHMVSLYLLDIWSLLSCLFLCGPLPIRLKVAPQKCFSCLSAFAQVVLSSRRNHSFLLSQPGPLLFPVILLEMCGDVSGYCSACGYFYTWWTTWSRHDKCPLELGKFLCQEGISDS